MHVERHDHWLGVSVKVRDIRLVSVVNIHITPHMDKDVRNQIFVESGRFLREANTAIQITACHHRSSLDSAFVAFSSSDGAVSAMAPNTSSMDGLQEDLLGSASGSHRLPVVYPCTPSVAAVWTSLASIAREHPEWECRHAHNMVHAGPWPKGTLELPIASVQSRSTHQHSPQPPQNVAQTDLLAAAI